jgi:hypothetical protein
MKKNKTTKIATRFAPELRFELRPVPPAPFRATQETEFERLKNRLLTQELTQATAPGFPALLRRAANDAAALAWDTVFPLLVFPVLFEEKAEVALRQLKKQARIYRNSRELFTV